jgi:hypothetical protein
MPYQPVDDIHHTGDHQYPKSHEPNHEGARMIEELHRSLPRYVPHAPHGVVAWGPCDHDRGDGHGEVVAEEEEERRRGACSTGHGEVVEEAGEAVVRLHGDSAVAYPMGHSEGVEVAAEVAYRRVQRTAKVRDSHDGRGVRGDHHA